MSWFKDKLEANRIETRDALAKAFEGKGLGECVTMRVPHVSETAMAMRCGGGYLVSYPTGDPGEYSEFATDFVTDEGRAMQLAVVGMDEDDHDQPKPDGYRNTHAYVYTDSQDEPEACYIRTDLGVYYNC